MGYKLTLLDCEVDALCSRGGYGATAATVKHLSVGGTVLCLEMRSASWFFLSHDVWDADTVAK